MPQQTVQDILIDKHPPGQPARPEPLLHPPSPALETHPVLFEQLDGEMIRSAAIQSKGSASPSGVDSQGWRCLCTSLRSASSKLYSSVALVARHICTNMVDQAGLILLTAYRLAVLIKCLGVCLIGIGQTIRQIMAKAILHILGPNIQEDTGSSQLCAGQEAGC